MSIEFCNLFSWCQPADKLREAEAYSRQLGGFEGSGKYDRGYRDLSRLRQVSRVTSSELDRNVVKSTDLVESIHGAFFSTLMVELKGDLEAVHEQVSKQNQRKALCWGVLPSVCCCSEKAETDFTYQSVYTEMDGACFACAASRNSAGLARIGLPQERPTRRAAHSSCTASCVSATLVVVRGPTSTPSSAQVESIETVAAKICQQLACITRLPRLLYSKTFLRTFR